MSVDSNYATGWYSISPAFAWWNNNPYRVAQVTARREAARVAEKDRQQKKINSGKITEGTIDVYA